MDAAGVEGVAFDVLLDEPESELEDDAEADVSLDDALVLVDPPPESVL